MNKALKYIGIISGCVLTQHLLNRSYLYLKSGKPRVNAKQLQSENFYKWRFGQIRYKIIGKGKPLLLIHGIYPGADMTQWKDIDPVIFQSFKVYAVDLLGFGRSSKPNISYTAYLYVRLINEFIRDIIQEPVITIASDYSAAYTVMGYIFNPELYIKQILISPTGITNAYKLPVLKDFIIRILLGLPVWGTSAYLFLTNKFLGNTMVKRLWKKRSIATDIPRHISPTAYFGGPSVKYPITALLSNYLNVNIMDKLKRMQIPVLMMSNEHWEIQSTKEFTKIMDFIKP